MSGPADLQRVAAELRRLLDRRPPAFDAQDERHAAYLAGVADGLARGQRLSGEAEADRRLVDLSRDFERLALRNASTKGPAWQRALLEQSRGWD